MQECKLSTCGVSHQYNLFRQLQVKLAIGYTSGLLIGPWYLGEGELTKEVLYLNKKKKEKKKVRENRVTRNQILEGQKIESISLSF